MNKKITCIECPNGCELSVTIEDGVLTSLTGNQCPKGETYAHAEIEHPVRILTSTVALEGASVRRLPVRTDVAIPRSSLMAAMAVLHAVTVSTPVHCGDIIVENLLNSGANVIATRSVM